VGKWVQIFIWGIFLNWGQMGANVIVEFKNVFFNWWHFF